jgi:hypothetical protein
LDIQKTGGPEKGKIKTDHSPKAAGMLKAIGYGMFMPISILRICYLEGSFLLHSCFSARAMSAGLSRHWAKLMLQRANGYGD